MERADPSAYSYLYGEEAPQLAVSFELSARLLAGDGKTKICRLTS